MRARRCPAPVADVPYRWQSAPVDSALLDVRRVTYALFVDLGRAPSLAEVSRHALVAEQEVASAWRELQDQHALVLKPNALEIRMANPFSGVPTPYRVHARGRWWYANCGWDAFGICAALGTDGDIEWPCADCGEPLSVEVIDTRPSHTDFVFHCFVPAREWWADIGFT